MDDDEQRIPDIVADDYASRKARLAERSTPSVRHFLPTSGAQKKTRPKVTRPTADDLEIIRRQGQEAEVEIAASLDAWKEKRRLKSQKSREFITGSTVSDNSSVSLREAESGTIKRSTTTSTNNNIQKTKYKELAQRYSDDVHVLEEEDYTSYSDSSQEVYEVFESSEPTMNNSSRARQGQPPPPPPPSSYQNGQIDSLATQLQKQKIATEGYAQFKQDFGKINSSPGASPSNFQKARKEQFRSKLGMFESQDELSDQASSRQGTLERLGSHEQRGVVDRARASLVNRNNERSSAPQQLVAEKYRRDLQAQVSFPDPPQQDYSQSSSRDLRSQSEHLARPTPVNDSLGARSISAPDDDELFSEVTVCMSQRPGSSRGFGFKVRGGDGVNPIIVDQITPGGAAFVCELSIGDEVISMNGLTVANLTQDQIVELMTEAVRTGQLRLRVRRYSTITRKKPLNQAPSLRLTSAAKMVATEGGFYQILADIPKKPRQTSQQQQQQHARPQQSASPAGTLDSGHGSEQMLEMRESPATRSPVASSTQSSPRHSPRRPVQSEPNNDDNPWLNELGSFELKQSGVSVKAPPQREIYQAKSISPDRSVLRKSLDRQLNNSNVARQLQDALDIEQEENQRELTERIRRQQQRDNDEYTETQISRSSNNNNHTAHWMVREAESRRQQFSVRK